jgi:hypothetical protein
MGTPQHPVSRSSLLVLNRTLWLLWLWLALFLQANLDKPSYASVRPGISGCPAAIRRCARGKIADLAKYGRVLVLLDACHSGAV